MLMTFRSWGAMAVSALLYMWCGHGSDGEPEWMEFMVLRVSSSLTLVNEFRRLVRVEFVEEKIGVVGVLKLSWMSMIFRWKEMASASHSSWEGGMSLTMALGLESSFTMLKSSLLSCALFFRWVLNEDLLASLRSW
ncbi:hypothetical protein NDU88_005881 [Pleurodeles waltl]|uniref:Secreted protein n=1 Tax=Pleurodeles waltl TaxID=8319 RepID=A0AAV7SN18_PLEWA|nr:hypothetical protein NDU88_005881 [Pleurodeles waltl]